MTKKKSTKRALLMSGLALMMCVSMLIGSTYAWFTDSVTSAGNVIQSGRLEVLLLDADGNNLEGETFDWVTADGRAQDQILWEPGCTYKTKAFYVKNDGNLALKYKIGINGIVGDAKLLEAIEWSVTVDGEEADLSGWLKPGESTKEMVLTGHMKEEAGNEYQGLTVEGISIAVFATQQTYENDSIDDQYDKMATVDDIDELTAALAADYDLITLGADFALDSSLNIPAGKKVTIDLAGYTISGVDTTEKNYGLINVGIGAELTIEDSVGTGKITLSATIDNGWNRYSSTISNQRGTLIVNGGTIEHTGGTAMSYAIDNLTNTGAEEAKTVINGGVVKSAYIGIRQYCNSTKGTNILEINGGTITGVRRSVWMQQPNSYANLAKLAINNGTFNGLVTAENDAFDVAIVGGIFDFDPSDLLSGGYAAAKIGDSTWTVVAPEEVSTADGLQKALDNGKNVVLTDDITLTKALKAITKDVVIDLNGYTIKAPSGMSMFPSQSNAAPSMTITSSKAGAVIDASNSTFTNAVVHCYGKTEIRNVTINAGSNTVVKVQGNGSVEIYDTVINANSGNPFYAAGDFTLGEGTVVNVTNLGSSLINNNGAHAIVIDGAEINIGTFKVNGGAIISLNKASTLVLNNTDVVVKDLYISQFGSYFISNANNATIGEDCTFNITDANGATYGIEFKSDAAGDKYAWVQNP